MKIITDPSDVDDPEVRRLVQFRFEQLAEYGLPIADMARFELVEAGDDVGWLLTNLVDGSRFGDPDFEPSWETLQRHGSWYEATFILDDAGSGHVYLIPDADGIDARLLSLCRSAAATQPADITNN
jgi:hypothetical protein